jgi:hypothetical protein
MKLATIFSLSCFLFLVGCSGSNQTALLPTGAEAKQLADAPPGKLTMLKPPIPTFPGGR